MCQRSVSAYKISPQCDSKTNPVNRASQSHVSIAIYLAVAQRARDPRPVCEKIPRVITAARAPFPLQLFFFVSQPRSRRRPRTAAALAGVGNAKPVLTDFHCFAFGKLGLRVTSWRVGIRRPGRCGVVLLNAEGLTAPGLARSDYWPALEDSSERCAIEFGCRSIVCFIDRANTRRFAFNSLY